MNSKYMNDVSERQYKMKEHKSEFYSTSEVSSKDSSWIWWASKLTLFLFLVTAFVTGLLIWTLPWLFFLLCFFFNFGNFLRKIHLLLVLFFLFFDLWIQFLDFSIHFSSENINWNFLTKLNPDIFSKIKSNGSFVLREDWKRNWSVFFYLFFFWNFSFGVILRVDKSFKIPKLWKFFLFALKSSNADIKKS